MGAQGGTAMKCCAKHNVTLDGGDGREFLGRPFPCPLCNMELRLKISCKQKPYCTCLECGIQIFFRGQEGIARLYDIIKSEQAVVLEFSRPARAISLYRRLHNLKRQRETLKKKQGIIFRDSDRELVIEALEGEIERVRTELKEVKENGDKQK